MYIGIDLGTSGVKLLIVTAKGAQIENLVISKLSNLENILD